MTLSKREKLLLIMLLIVALLLIEFRLIITPGLEKYDRLIEERDAAQDEVQMIELNMAEARQNEKKRDENLTQIRELSDRYFNELQTDALLVRTHDLLLEEGLNPSQYQIQPIQASSPVPEEYMPMTLSYELKNLSQAYWLLTGNEQPGSQIPEETQDLTGVNDQIEQLQISFSARGTYSQLNDYLNAITKLNRSLIVTSLDITPEAQGAPEVVEEMDQILSYQVNVCYYGITKLIPTEDLYNRWYREPFKPVEYSPFRPLPVPVVTVSPTFPSESSTEQTP
ncbi:MAG: hypothetical protein KBG64_00825 [Clostridia bacterium]|nr:hypothetical protein [Clostridia bacterium]